MSEEKIASKTDLSSKAAGANNGVTEVMETKTDLKHDNSAGIQTGKGENVKAGNTENVLPADEPLANAKREPKINFEVSSLDLLDQPSKSIIDPEHLQEETTAEQTDFYRSTDVSEMNLAYEMEENELTTQRDTVISHKRIQDIVNPYDPNVVRLQTETHVLQLSKLPVVPPEVPQSSHERLFEVESVSLDSMEILSYKESSHDIIEYDRTHFFENLADIPDVEDMSSESERRVSVVDYRNRRGSGRFVHPLTGSRISVFENEIIEVQEKDYLDEVSTEEEFEEEDPSRDFEFEDFDAMLLDDEKQLPPKLGENEEEMLDILITKNQMEGKILFSTDQEEKETKEALRLAEIRREQIDKFLSDLIKHVVRIVENEEHAGKLRQNLDKLKLFQKIEAVVNELHIDLSVRKFLDRKATEYYRRRHLLRYIIPEKSDQLAMELEKNKIAEEQLDFLLGEEKFMISKASAKIEELQIEKTEFEEAERTEIAKFERLVKNTLKREEMPHLIEYIEKDLRKILDLSKEISEVRARVIHQQHNLGTLKSRIEEQENIGNGLRVADYEEIQRQTETINKKIEDRNHDLSKLHDRFRTSLHVMAHSSLRTEMFARRISLQNKTLNILESERALCRKSIFELKKQRKTIKQQISELSLQSGLLDKPILLHDYDITLEEVEKRRKIVDELRYTQKRMEQKLKSLEKDCTIK